MYGSLVIEVLIVLGQLLEPKTSST